MEAKEIARTPAPVITVEPATVADVIEAAGIEKAARVVGFTEEKDVSAAAKATREVRNADGDVMGYTYAATETGRFIDAEVVEKVDPYEMPPSRIRYNTPPMMRYPSDREDLSEFAKDFFEKCQAISREKNLRYAGEFDPFKNFRLGGQFGIAIRMTDKVSRLLTLTEPGCKIDGADESVEDTCADLANYAMLLCAMRANERS